MKNMQLHQNKEIKRRFCQNQLHFSGGFFSLIIFLSALMTVSPSAATFQVTNTADSGAGSLRQAVSDANATAADDTIHFNIPTADPTCDAGGVCTITLTGGVVSVPAAGGALVISNQQGGGRLLIWGNNCDRICFSR